MLGPRILSNCSRSSFASQDMAVWGQDQSSQNTQSGDETSPFRTHSLGTRLVLTEHIVWRRDQSFQNTQSGDKTSSFRTHSLGTRLVLTEHTVWGQDQSFQNMKPGDKASPHSIYNIVLGLIFSTPSGEKFSSCMNLSIILTASLRPMSNRA